MRQRHFSGFQNIGCFGFIAAGSIIFLLFYLLGVYWLLPSFLSYGSANQPATPQLTSASPQSSLVIQALQTPNTISSTKTFDLNDMQKYMLELVNEDRQNADLKPVAWDDFAAQVGQAHATEMAYNDYMSHWDLKGFGPDLRYSFAGGYDYVMENVYSSYSRYPNGTPVPIIDWRKEIRTAETSFMSSPGHMSNILNPDHTHFGVGIAYDYSTGEFRVAQEFINHYLVLDAPPKTARPGSSVIINGQLNTGSTDPLINLAYEPVPKAMSVAELNKTSTYSSPAQYEMDIIPKVDDSGNFSAHIQFGPKEGFYHVRTWVKTNEANPLAADWIIQVSNQAP